MTTKCPLHLKTAQLLRIIYCTADISAMLVGVCIFHVYLLTLQPSSQFSCQFFLLQSAISFFFDEDAECPGFSWG